MIRLGCHSLNFGPRSLEDAMRLVHDLGFRIIDAAASDTEGRSQVDQRAAVGNPAGEAARIREYAEQHGLELDELFVCFVLADPA